MSVLDFLDEELAQLESTHRRRIPRVVGGAQGPRIMLDGRETLSFSSNDYLGLASHPTLAAAARSAIDRYGIGAGASRLIVGNSEAHRELETEAALLLGAESARLFNSGFAANTGLLPVLAGVGDQIFSDELNHASVIDGCRLSRATVQVFRHKNLNDLEELLSRSSRGRRVIVTESVFSMDGDRADIAALRTLADRHQAILVVDDAHATGVFAPAPTLAHATMATLGKALGVYGAVVAGPRKLTEVLWNRARSLVFTTGLPPMVAAAGTAAIRLVQSEEGTRRRASLWSRIRQLADGLRGLGFEASGESPIAPILVGNDRAVMEWTGRLLERGIFVQGVRPPTVPDGTARLRIAVTAAHSEEDVARLLEALRVSRGTGTP